MTRNTSVMSAQEGRLCGYSDQLVKIDGQLFFKYRTIDQFASNWVCG